MKKQKNYYRKILLGVLISAIVILFLASLFAEKIAPHDPILINYNVTLQPPSFEYPFGTDDFGRCIFSRVLYGTHSSLSMSLMIVFICTIMGTALGLISGYYGGKIDEVIMRITDMFLAFPGLVISIAVVGILGVGWMNTAIALMIPGWIPFTRLSRSLVLTIREKDYIKSAKAAGLKTNKILIKYVVPNMFQQVFTISAIEVGSMIISFCALAYLGLGAQPPQPELGLMLNEAKSKMQIAPWMLIFPGLSIFLIVVLFNLLSDVLRDIMDPSNIT